MADSERPLNPRGRAAAPLIGRYLASENLVPDRMLCSTSVRTRETQALAFAGVPQFPQPHFLDSLYLATPPHLLDVLRKCADSVAHLMVIGHNPGLHDLALDLIAAGPPDARRRLVAKLPTAGLVVIRFESDHWRDVASGAGQLARFVTPRDLGLVTVSMEG